MENIFNEQVIYTDDGIKILHRVIIYMENGNALQEKKIYKIIPPEIQTYEQFIKDEEDKKRMKQREYLCSDEYRKQYIAQFKEKMKASKNLIP